MTSNTRYAIVKSTGPCPTCGGNKIEAHGFEPCVRCGGDGQIWASWNHYHGRPMLFTSEESARDTAIQRLQNSVPWRIAMVPPCPRCSATGCPSCGGDGYRLTEYSAEMSVPSAASETLQSDPGTTIGKQEKQKGADDMEKESKFDGWHEIPLWELEEIFAVLEPEAEALGGNFLILDDALCFRCDDCEGAGGVVSMNFRIPPDLGSLIPDETGKPLVLVNLPLCRKCIIRITAKDTLRKDLVNKYVSKMTRYLNDEAVKNNHPGGTPDKT